MAQLSSRHGSPPGVGRGIKPATFLKAGDVVTLGIDGLGEQRQKVVKEGNEGHHARACRGHPRLLSPRLKKGAVAACRPALS
jgi:hypothetical protein